MAAVTTCSDFGAPLPPKKSLSLFPLFPHLFAMKWWDQMPGSKNTFYVSVAKHILSDSQFGDHDWIIHIPPRCWLLSPLVERGRLVQSPGCQSVSQGTTEGSWLNEVLWCAPQESSWKPDLIHHLFFCTFSTRSIFSQPSMLRKWSRPLL